MKLWCGGAEWRDGTQSMSGVVVGLAVSQSPSAVGEEGTRKKRDGRAGQSRVHAPPPGPGRCSGKMGTMASELLVRLRSRLFR
jgi:hypothetical protein